MEIVLVRHALPVRIDATPDGSAATRSSAERGLRQAERVVQHSPARRHRPLHLPLATRPRDGGARSSAPWAVTAEIEHGIAEFDVKDSSYVPGRELKAARDPRWRRCCTATSTATTSTRWRSGSGWWTRSSGSWRATRAVARSVQPCRRDQRRGRPRPRSGEDDLVPAGLLLHHAHRRRARRTPGDREPQRDGPRTRPAGVAPSAEELAQQDFRLCG
jgi:hypothetical protein